MMTIVFIAIGLFGALCFIMARDNGGNMTAMSSEQARLNAAEIIQYGNSLRQIVDRMMLLGGVSDTDSPAGAGILFDAPGAGSTPLTRELFESTGGNAAYMAPPPGACNSTCAYVFSGQYTVTGVGSDANPELTMLLVDVPQQVCQMVNTVLGLGSAIPTGTALTTVAPFNGTNYGAATAITLAGGQRALCYQEATGAGRYIYVNVIRAR